MTKTFLGTIAGCLVVIAVTPILFSGAASLRGLAIWLTIVGASMGLLGSLAHIALTKGELSRGWDWRLEAESPWLKRGRRVALLFGTGCAAAGLGAITFGAYWYPRPDPRGIDPSSGRLCPPTDVHRRLRSCGRDVSASDHGLPGSQ